MARTPEPITEDKREFIRANWERLSLTDISKQIGISVKRVIKWARADGLGTKPVIRKQVKRFENTVEPPPVPPLSEDANFMEMLDTVYKTLDARRLDIIDQIDRLESLNSEDRTVRETIKGLSKELVEIEGYLVKAYSLIQSSMFLRKRTQSGISSFGALIDFLDEPKQRESYGIMAAKMKHATKLVQQQWSEPIKYANDEWDCVYLAPELFEVKQTTPIDNTENEQEGGQADEDRE